MKVADAIVLCRKASANTDGTTTLDGLFDVVTMRRFPDRLVCSAYCKLEAEVKEIGATRKVRIELAPEAGQPLATFEREATIKGAAYDATPTLEILWDIDAVFHQPGPYVVRVSLGGKLVGSSPLLIVGQTS